MPSAESAPDGLHVVGLSLDCADPALLAGFYRDLLGGELLWSKAGSAGVRVPGLTIVAQLVEDYRPPRWPGAAIVHLDLSAGAALDEPAARAERLGATVVEPQPDPRWRVLLDPAGHPFCITTLTPEAPGAPRRPGG